MRIQAKILTPIFLVFSGVFFVQAILIYTITEKKVREEQIHNDGNEVFLTKQKKDMLEIIILIWGFTILFLYLVLSKFIKNITSPLTQLALQLNNFEYKNVETFKTIDSKDEIGSLSKTFTTLFKELKNTDEKIRKQVKEQTRTIQVQQKNLIKFKQAVECASDFITILDTQGNIVYMNPALSVQTGYSLEECNKKSPIEFRQSSLTKKNFIDILEKTRKLQKSFVQNFEAIKKDGTSFPAREYISPIYDTEKNIIFFLSIQHDTSEEQALNKLKDEFISLASHELRTPMTIIRSYTDLFLKGNFGKLTIKQKDYLERIHNNVIGLLSMVNDMLDISRLEAKKTSFHNSRFLITDIIQQIHGEFEQICIQKNIKFSISSEQVSIYSDKDKVYQVLVNLVGNAVKFTASGGKIEMRAYTSKKQKKFFCVDIQDSGIGIKKEDIGKLFKKFGQIESPLEKKEKGTGLGLALCKKIAQEMGGEILVKTEYEVGSTFTLVLPKKSIN